MDYLIDGYNLLHFAGLARARYGPGDFDRARRRLLGRLARELNQSERTRTIVVFDGRHAPGALRGESLTHGIRVLFSPEGLEADDTIEDLIRRHSAPRQLTIVSSDRRLRRAARARSAHCLDSDAFLERFGQRADQQRVSASRSAEERAKYAENPASGIDNLDYWLREFADLIPTDSDPAPLRPAGASFANVPIPPPQPAPDRAHASKDANAPALPHTQEPPAAKPAAPPDGKHSQQPRSKKVRGNPAAKPLLESPESGAELTFWTERIAELFKEEERGP